VVSLKKKRGFIEAKVEILYIVWTQ